MEAALDLLLAGEVDTVIADRKDLDDLMPPHPPKGDDTAALPYQELRYLANLDRSEGVAILPIAPAFPGRLSVALRQEDAAQNASVRAIFGGRIAVVTGDFADAKFLSRSRSLVLFDLKILNDLNLPHLQMIAEAFLQPARRNGELLLLRILADASIYTFSEAIFGFVFGAVLGFILGTVFAHSRLMERGLLPYVVASQTVPILAIAPMVVIWLGAGQLSVAVIAAYLTFFPVTINTLRGLQSPAAEQIELMRSYASSRWTIMWKLRLPAALPYIFTALKVSATASVVGAIIGELPSGIGDGLGRAILDFSSDYSMVSTPKLWASIMMAATVGIVFFVSVSLAERFLLRGYIRDVD
jgi:NitT/TauT family transport system permease protein